MRYKLYKVVFKERPTNISEDVCWVVAKSLDTASSKVRSQFGSGVTIKSIEIVASQPCPKEGKKYDVLILEGGESPTFETKEVVKSAQLKLTKENGIVIEKQFEGEPEKEDKNEPKTSKKVIDIVFDETPPSSNEEEDDEGFVTRWD